MEPAGTFSMEPLSMAWRYLVVRARAHTRTVDLLASRSVNGRRHALIVRAVCAFFQVAHGAMRRHGRDEVEKRVRRHVGALSDHDKDALDKRRARVLHPNEQMHALVLG